MRTRATARSGSSACTSRPTSRRRSNRTTRTATASCCYIAGKSTSSGRRSPSAASHSSRRASTSRTAASRSSSPLLAARKAETSGETSPSARRSAESSASSNRVADQFELELLAVLVVPVAANLDEPQPADDRQGRLVLRPDRGDEAADALSFGGGDQRAHRLRRIPAPPVLWEDRVADLHRVGVPARVHPGRAVKADVPDHRPVAFREHDRPHVPGPAARVLLRLPQPELEEPPVVVVGKPRRDREAADPRHLLAPPVEERLDQPRREPHELQPLRADRFDVHAGEIIQATIGFGMAIL